MSEPLSEQLSEAWEAHHKGDFASQLARQSLSASVHSHAGLQSTLRKLKKPAQEELKLRLTGAGIIGHSTNPESLAVLYQEISNAVKAIGKTLSGKSRWTSGLLASAPTAGSIEIRFEAPDLPKNQETISGAEMIGFEAQSLRQIVNLFAQAADDLDEELLLSSTAILPSSARQALKRIATTASTNNWNVESTLRARDRETLIVELTPKGANRLISATEMTTQMTEEVRLSGKGDGWAWSTAKLRFIPDHGSAFSASVPPPLQLRVAKLVATPDVKLRATFYRTEVRPSGSNSAIATTYSLVEVEPIEQ